MQRVVVVIPTYNEAENLPLLVPRVLEQDARITILVVDDSSPDGTGKLADELAASTGRRGTSKLTLRIGLEALWIVWWLRLADLAGRL